MGSKSYRRMQRYHCVIPIGIKESLLLYLYGSGGLDKTNHESRLVCCFNTPLPPLMSKCFHINME